MAHTTKFVMDCNGFVIGCTCWVVHWMGVFFHTHLMCLISWMTVFSQKPSTRDIGPVYSLFNSAAYFITQSCLPQCHDTSSLDLAIFLISSTLYIHQGSAIPHSEKYQPILALKWILFATGPFATTCICKTWKSLNLYLKIPLHFFKF